MSYEEAVLLLEMIQEYIEFQEVLAAFNSHLTALTESESETE